ncbi:hypothetical protein GCM10007907_09500 [Chitinimonas prasina]|uniref:PilZ domain-containing protein n=1 Tax=Chitinimonas prasina TaxID=1434937 RepID=A0ABQ5YFN9_9NEIS|nr:hypothetical protein [Chitinimonas prasina]GLR12160.1 hypothetical protein GCM10007907_09500 [Chitinimonas prasina]
MERTLHIRKFANAFSTSTKIKPSFSEVPAVGDFAIDAVERYKIKHGGAWVGGSVEITGNGICFTENAMNRAINPHPLTVHIAMLDILSVHREFGWVTGIIVVYHREGEFRFRCFGAKTVAKRLSAYLAAC